MQSTVKRPKQAALVRVMKGFTKRRLNNRSRVMDGAIFLFLAFGAFFMGMPLILAVSSAFKPLDEFWLFPPTILPIHPTLRNFSDLFTIMSNSLVPFTRYLYNTVFITLVGTFGHVMIASMCAYALAKFRFKGKNLIFSAVVLSLMFSGAVTGIPNFMIMQFLGFVDTHLAIIIPAIGASLGLYLMKQFMEQIPDTYIESARVEGAMEIQIFWRIVMPMVKPAWLTLTVLSVQALWNTGASVFIFQEELKPLGFAVSQIMAGSAGVARAGVGAAVGVVMMSVPIVTFLVTQSGIIETMGSSGLKE